MNDIKFDKLCVQMEIHRQFVNQLRDKIFDNMHLDDVEVDAVEAYIKTCTIEQLIELNKIAEVLDDWQLIGRIIGNAVIQFEIKG